MVIQGDEISFPAICASCLAERIDPGNLNRTIGQAELLETTKVNPEML